MWDSSSTRDSVSAAPSSFSIPASRGQPKIWKKEQNLDKIRSINASCGQPKIFFKKKKNKTWIKFLSIPACRGQPKILEKEQNFNKIPFHNASCEQDF